jgi:GNAT superfamily N-acetyltransferase
MTATEPTPLSIGPVDPSDPASFAPFYDVYAAAHQHGPAGEFATVWQAEEVRVAMENPDPRTFRLGWVGRAGGDRAVATGWLEGSTVDNTDLAEVTVCCAPDARGRGYAAAMLAHVEQEARGRGRERLVGRVDWPYAAGSAGTGSPDLAWARRNGFELGLVDVQRRLALPVPTARLDELAAEAAAHHKAYTLRSFTGPVPDDLVEEWTALGAILATEAPMGDIQREEEVADVDRYRAEEALVERQGRAKVSTGAQGPDGRLVAYTDLVLTVHEPERAYQWGTLVRPDHRGHRLGLAVKVANVRLLQETYPQVSTVVTYNADVNAPMVAVNERLGFVPVQWMGEVQKRLDGGAPRLRL